MKLPAALAARAADGTLAHAYILAADAPAALTDAAAATAAALVCGGEGGTPPCGVCKHCRKVEKGIHPDVITVAPEPGKELTVDRIRDLRQDAYIRPNEAARKVYLVKDAHKMNASAQNAFLKVLEEGPEYAVFVLLSPNPSALLPTIRSRCEQVSVTAKGQTDPELERKAGELAGLLLGDDAWRRLAWCVAWEKAKREEVIPLWEETRRALLTYRTAKTTAKAVALCQCLEELLAAAPSGNMGVLWGKLWAQAG